MSDPSGKLRKIPVEPKPLTSAEIAEKAKTAKRIKIDVYGESLSFCSWKSAKNKVAAFAKQHGVTEDDVRIAGMGQLRTRRFQTDAEHLARIKSAAEYSFRQRHQTWQYKVREVERHNATVQAALKAANTASKDDQILIKELKSRGYVVSKAL